MESLNYIHNVSDLILDVKMLAVYLEKLQIDDDIENALYLISKCREYLKRVNRGEPRLKDLYKILSPLLP